MVEGGREGGRGEEGWREGEREEGRRAFSLTHSLTHSLTFSFLPPSHFLSLPPFLRHSLTLTSSLFLSLPPGREGGRVGRRREGEATRSDE